MADALSLTLTPLLILRILERYSDEQHPLTREQIEEHLDEYAINIERKTFARHIKHLNEMEDVDIKTKDVIHDWPVKSRCLGYYLDARPFSETDLRLIIDSLAGNAFLSEKETAELIQQVAALGGQHFEHKMKSYQFLRGRGKSENRNLIYNLELIDEAKEKHLQIAFDLLYTDQRGKTATSRAHYRCTPLQQFVKDRNYYLVGIVDRVGQYRLETFKISQMVNPHITKKPTVDIRTVPGYENGIDWQTFLREHPSMENLRGKAEMCTFLCTPRFLEEIKHYFGPDVRVIPKQETQMRTTSNGETHAYTKYLLEVSVYTDPHDAITFAEDHSGYVRLLAPHWANRRLRHGMMRRMEHYQRLEKTVGAGVPAKVFKDRQEKDINHAIPKKKE